MSSPVASFRPRNADFDQRALWHLCRAGSPPVTAIVKSAGRDVVLEVTYGTVARQRVVCVDSLEAVQRAERLRTQLEGRGYHRTRRDRRDATAAPRRA